MPRPASWLTLTLTLALTASGCVLRPAGTAEERTRLTTSGQPYVPPVEQRELPDVPDPADYPFING